MYKEALIRNTYQGILANRPRDLTEEELEALAVAEKEVKDPSTELSLLVHNEKCHVGSYSVTYSAFGAVADISDEATCIASNTKDALNEATFGGDGDVAGGRGVGLGLPPLPESVAAQRAGCAYLEGRPSLKVVKEGEAVGVSGRMCSSVLDSPMSRITAHTMSNAPSTPQLNDSHSHHLSTAAACGVHTHIYVCEEARSQTPHTVTSTCSHDLHADGPHDTIVHGTNTAALGAKAKYVPPSRRGGASPAIISTCAPEGQTSAPRIRLGHEDNVANTANTPINKTSFVHDVTVHSAGRETMSESLRENSVSLLGASTTTFFCSLDDRSGAAAVVSAAAVRVGTTRTFASPMAKIAKTEELVAAAVKYSTLPQRKAGNNDDEDDEKPSVPLRSMRGSDAVEALRGAGAATNESSPSAGDWNWVEDNEDEFYEMLNESSEDFTANSLSVMCAQQNKNPSQKLIVLSSRQGGTSAHTCRQKGSLPPLAPSAATSAPHRRGGGGGAPSRKTSQQQASHADDVEEEDHNHGDDHDEHGSADERDADHNTCRGGHKGGRSAKGRGKGRVKGKRDPNGATTASGSVSAGNSNSSNRGTAHAKGKDTSSLPSSSGGRFDSLKR